METKTTTVCIPAGWPATEEQARAVQDELRARVVLDEPGPPPGTGQVTGVDVAYDDERDVVVAAAVVLDAATLDVVAEATAVGRVSFPYVPGLLAFREIPDRPGRAGGPAVPARPGRLRRLRTRPPAPLRPRQPPRRPHRAPHDRRRQEPVHLLLRGARRPARIASPLLRGRRGGGPRPAHPGRGQAGVRLRRPPHRASTTPAPTPSRSPREVPPPGDDPPGGRPVQAGPEGSDRSNTYERGGSDDPGPTSPRARA